MPRRREHSREQILDALQRWLLEHGQPPTVDELRRLLHLGSTRTALRYLSSLEEAGDIERWAGARGLRLLRGPDGLTTKAVGIVGTAPAGPLLAAEENFEGWVRLPADFLKGKTRYFLLRVRGDSMNLATVGEDRIENGDMVLVKQQATAEAGAIVVALIDGQATIKRFVKAAGYYVLRPESTTSTHQPIVVGEDFKIQGVVDRVLKKGSEVFGLVED